MPKGYEVERVALKNEARLPVPKGARLIVLDERGTDLTTAQFAQLLAAPAVFVIGGADGLSAATKDKADKLLTLGDDATPRARATRAAGTDLSRRDFAHRSPLPS